MIRRVVFPWLPLSAARPTTDGRLDTAATAVSGRSRPVAAPPASPHASLPTPTTLRILLCIIGVPWPHLALLPPLLCNLRYRAPATSAKPPISTSRATGIRLSKPSTPRAHLWPRGIPM